MLSIAFDLLGSGVWCTGRVGLWRGSGCLVWGEWGGGWWCGEMCVWVLGEADKGPRAVTHAHAQH